MKISAEGCPQTSCCSGSGHLLHIHPVSSHNTGILLHARLQPFKNIRSSSLLLSKGIGCSVRPCKRIVYITHNRNFRFRGRRMKTAHINPVHLFQILSAAFQFPAFRIQKTDSQRPHGAHTAVIGGTSANRYGNLSVSLL